MSLDEAREVTTTFAGRSLVAPPRTTDDIISMLANGRPDETHERAIALQAIRVTPREGAPPSELADFFLSRGRTFLSLGRPRAAIADLTEAARNAERAGLSKYEIPILLAFAYSSGGNNLRTLQLLDAAVLSVPSYDQGHLFGLYFVLVAWHSYAGDLANADRILARIVALHSDSQRWPPTIAAVHRARWAGQVEGARGFVLAARGKLRLAEAAYRGALNELDRYPETQRLYGYDFIRASLASVLAQRGALLAAEAEARQAVLGSFRRNGRESNQTGLMLHSLASVVRAQGRFREAEQLADVAIAVHQAVALPASGLLAATRGERAAVLAAQERWPEVLAEFESIEAELEGDSTTFRRFFGTSLERPLALTRTGRAQLALPMIRESLERLRRARGDSDVAVGEERGVLAVVLHHLDAKEEAVREFARAVSIFERAGSTNEDQADAARGAWLRRLILNDYIDLLWQLHEEGARGGDESDAARAAFRLVDLGRSRVVQRAFVAAGLRTTTDPALRDLIRREQDAAQQLSSMQGALANLLGFGPEHQNPASVTLLQREIKLLTEARETLLAQVERQAPGYLSRLDPSPSTVAEVKAALKAGEAMVVVHTTSRRTYVWAVPADGAMVFGSSPIGEKDVAAIVGAVRRGLEPAKTTADIRVFDVGAAHRLYAATLEPARSGWGRAQTLLVVADPALGGVPFGILPTAAVEPGLDTEGLFSGYRHVPWLIASHAITHLPSVATLPYLRSLPSGNRERRPFIGFGDPIFSVEQQLDTDSRRVDGHTARSAESSAEPLIVRGSAGTARLQTARLASLPRLPETTEEIRIIGTLLGADPARDIVLGVEASEAAVQGSDLSRYRIIAFATHGLAAGDLDGLDQPALALTSPDVAKTGGDGLLTMEEIMRLRLDADWVVLSACNSAAGRNEEAEAISGLGRAFFYAGSRALLVTAWPVETTSARALTTALFQRQTAASSTTRASALQYATISLIKTGSYPDSASGMIRFTYAHPIFWAPFMLVGDGGL